MGQHYEIDICWPVEELHHYVILKPICIHKMNIIMIVKEVEVNGSLYKFTLTGQVLSQVDRLKNLYSQAYDDPEAFEQISSDIAGTISNIAAAIEPPASDNDLDGVIQEIITTVDNRKAEMNKQVTRKRRRKR